MTDALLGTLRQARSAARLSQLALSLRLGVSQRHVSFVESGRAKPSRELLINWLQELNAPLVLRNAAMLQAGYAPAYSAAPLNDPALAQATAAMRALLQTHEPMPAFVVDAEWNVRDANRGALWLVGTMAPALAAGAAAGGALNMLDLLSHPEGLVTRIVNLREVGPPLLAHLREEAALLPALAPRVEAFATALHARIGAQSPARGAGRPLPPVLTTRFATPFGELAFFSMLTTFGTPQDITLASLRIEHMFAADEATRAVIRAQLG
jgi:transcriptional regulator with XRE-family HTH domain